MLCIIIIKKACFITMYEEGKLEIFKHNFYDVLFIVFPGLVRYLFKKVEWLLQADKVTSDAEGELYH